MRLRLLSLVLLIGAIANGQTAAQPVAEVFRNPTAGFALTKPASWHYGTAAQNAANLKATKLNDEQFQAEMLKYASAPMVILTKFAEPYEDLNPSLKVNIRAFGALKGRSATEIIKLMLPQFEKAFQDFAIVQPPTELLLSDQKAGYVRIHYTLTGADDATFPTASELWIVPRGDFFFLIGAGTRQDEKTGSRREIAEIIKSIKIDP